MNQECFLSEKQITFSQSLKLLKDKKSKKLQTMLQPGIILLFLILMN